MAKMIAVSSCAYQTPKKTLVSVVLVSGIDPICTSCSALSFAYRVHSNVNTASPRSPEPWTVIVASILLLSECIK